MMKRRTEFLFCQLRENLERFFNFIESKKTEDTQNLRIDFSQEKEFEFLSILESLNLEK